MSLSSNPQPWVVVGTGALSMLWAEGLQAAGAETWLYTRHQSDGAALTINVSAGGEQRRTRLPVIHSAAAAPANALWLIMVKAWQLQPLLQQLFKEGLPAGKLTNSTLIISHNGMGAAEPWFALYPQVPVYDLVTTHGAWRPSRLHSVHAGVGESWLGPRKAGQHAASEPPAWLAILRAALAPLHWEADIELRRWQKLAINCAINPLASLAGAANGVLRDSCYQGQIRAICEEISNVQPRLDADELVAAVQQVVRATAGNRCSMLQDLQAGQRTEIDFLSGFVCREGQRLQVTTRVNCDLWQALKQRENNEKE